MFCGGVNCVINSRRWVACGLRYWGCVGRMERVWDCAWSKLVMLLSPMVLLWIDIAAELGR